MYTKKVAMIIITTFSMIIKEMYMNSSYIDIIMIIAVKICHSYSFHNRNSYDK